MNHLGASPPFSSHSTPFQTLAEALLAAPPDRLFVVMWTDEDDIETVNFGQFREQAIAHLRTFETGGLQRGDTIVLIMPQGIPLMAAFAGALLMGAVPAILAYPNFKVEPAKYRAGLAGVTANLKARLVLLDEEFPENMLDNVRLTGDSRLMRAGRFKGGTAKLAPIEFSPDQVAFIQHSAGTTGLQKGVALSHSAVLRQLYHLSRTLRIRPEDRIYSWLPLYHDMGLIACFMLPMVMHLPVIMQSPTAWVMQPRTMLELISRHSCSLAWVPNFALQFLARRTPDEDLQGLDLSSLRGLINCSEPVRAFSMDEFRSRFSGCGLPPHALQSCYAMAETVFAVTHSAMDGRSDPRRLWIDRERLHAEGAAVEVPSDHPAASCWVSSGRWLPGSEVRVVTADGTDLPDGAVGEILIRSDSLFEGYYNRPDLTAQALRNGWYWSGDLGFRWDGELYVIGRNKDLIIVAGKNIYPQDVEEIVSSHPAIHDGRAVALGWFNSDLGTEEIVVVAEVEDEAYLVDAASIERCLLNMIVAELGVATRAVYLKPPKWIVKSTAGKAARSTTREKLIAEHPELQAEGE